MKKESEVIDFKNYSSEALAEVRDLYGKVLTIQSGKPTQVTAEVALVSSLVMLKNYCEIYLKEHDPDKH